MRPTPPLSRRRGRRRRRPQIGLILRRDPRAWWAAMLAVAVGLGGATATLVARAEHVRQGWGTTAEVLVARRDLAPGDQVQGDDVTVKARPVALIPTSALRSLPHGAVARAAMLAGEVIVAERIAPTGLRGVAALLPAGTRAMAIPTEPGSAPPRTPGDHVEVLVALPPESAGGGPPGFALVADALVVAITEGTVTIAVPRGSAPRIAVALGLGAVTLALIGA